MTYQRFRTFQISSLSANNNISLIILAHIYLIFSIHSLSWISITFRTFLADIFQIYLGDSIFCRIQISVLFFLTSTFFYNLIIQAFYRYNHIIHGADFHTLQFYIRLIILSWLVSLLALIPAYTLFDVFAYLPEQNHCRIIFSNLRGYIYSFLVCFMLPSLLIFYIYSQIIIFIRQLPKYGLLIQRKRDMTIITNIFKLCFGISLVGSPTIFFLCQYILTGQLHFLIYRIDELWLSVNTISLILSMTFLNSLFENQMWFRCY